MKISFYLFIVFVVCVHAEPLYKVILTVKIIERFHDLFVSDAESLYYYYFEV